MAPASSPSARRVLIVDDNRALAENVAEILEMEGYVTEVAGSAEEALAKAGPAGPDVVVTDYRLPDTNGANLLRRLRAMGMRMSAIVISAHSDDGTIADARSAGATFVPKPLDFALLGQAIRDRDVPGR